MNINFDIEEYDDYRYDQESGDFVPYISAKLVIKIEVPGMDEPATGYINLRELKDALDRLK